MNLKKFLKKNCTSQSFRNPIFFIMLLPIIFIFLIIYGNINQESTIKKDFWPTNWNKLKKTKNKFDGSYYPNNLERIIKEAHTIKFKSNITEACRYRNALKKELKNEVIAELR